MKLLNEIIEEFLVDSERKNFLKFIKEFRIEESIMELYGQLEKILNNDHKELNKVTLTTISSNLLIVVNQNLAKVKVSELKQTYENLILKLVTGSILSTLRTFPYDSLEIVDLIQETVSLTAKTHGWNLEELIVRLNLEESRNAIKQISGITQIGEIENVTCNMNLIWTKKVDLGILATPLKELNFIKSKTEFYKAFEIQDKTVRWNMNYKYELAHLLYKLSQGDYIRPLRGYLKRSNRIFIDFDNEFLKKDSLKRISSRINKEPEKHSTTIRTIDDIIANLEKIFRTIRRLM